MLELISEEDFITIFEQLPLIKQLSFFNLFDEINYKILDEIKLISMSNIYIKIRSCCIKDPAFKSYLLFFCVRDNILLVKNKPDGIKKYISVHQYKLLSKDFFIEEFIKLPIHKQLNITFEMGTALFDDNKKTISAGYGSLVINKMFDQFVKKNISDIKTSNFPCSLVGLTRYCASDNHPFSLLASQEEDIESILLNDANNIVDIPKPDYRYKYIKPFKLIDVVSFVRYWNLLPIARKSTIVDLFEKYKNSTNPVVSIAYEVHEELIKMVTIAIKSKGTNTTADQIFEKLLSLDNIILQNA